jgi:hypothetical protein
MAGRSAAFIVVRYGDGWECGTRVWLQDGDEQATRRPGTWADIAPGAHIVPTVKLAGLGRCIALSVVVVLAA